MGVKLYFGLFLYGFMSLLMSYKFEEFTFDEPDLISKQYTHYKYIELVQSSRDMKKWPFLTFQGLVLY